MTEFTAVGRLLRHTDMLSDKIVRLQRQKQITLAFLQSLEHNKPTREKIEKLLRDWERVEDEV